MHRRTILITKIILGIPLLDVAVSLVTAYNVDEGGSFVVLGAVLYGSLGLVASLIAGPLVAYFTRKLKNQKLSLLGYIVPSLAAFVQVFWGFVSVVIMGNPSPY